MHLIFFSLAFVQMLKFHEFIQKNNENIVNIIGNFLLLSSGRQHSTHS